MFIDSTGVVTHPRVRRAIAHGIEGAAMPRVHGIVVHQTDSSSAESTLSQYSRPKSNGARFLIDKDGTIYQTASVYKQTRHVGLLKSRCIITKVCEPAEFKAASKLAIHPLSQHEHTKPWPARYPSNQDSVGIELVGKHSKVTDVYETVTEEQNASLKWLIGELVMALGVQMTEIYRHPAISYKKSTEALTAKW